MVFGRPLAARRAVAHAVGIVYLERLLGGLFLLAGTAAGRYHQLKVPCTHDGQATIVSHPRAVALGQHVMSCHVMSSSPSVWIWRADLSHRQAAGSPDSVPLQTPNT